MSGFYLFMTYEEQLNDPNWKAKRFLILERDWFMCQQCMSSQKLQVHHKKYIDGLMAWEYPNNLLITLCERCHQQIHGIGTQYFGGEIRPIKTIAQVFKEMIHG